MLLSQTDIGLADAGEFAVRSLKRLRNILLRGMRFYRPRQSPQTPTMIGVAVGAIAGPAFLRPLAPSGKHTCTCECRCQPRSALAAKQEAVNANGIYEPHGGTSVQLIVFLESSAATANSVRFP